MRANLPAGMPDELRPRHLLRRALHLVVALLLVGVAVAALPGLGGVRSHLVAARPGWLLAATAAELGSALAYVVVLRAVFCPCMRWGPSYQLGMSELAANSLLPAGGAGGLALGAWALRRGGVSTDHIANRTVVFFLVTSAANFAAVIAAGIGLSLGVLPGGAAIALTLTPALLAIAAVLIVAFVLPRLLDRVSLATSSGSAAGGVRARTRGFLSGSSGVVATGVRETVSLLGSGRAPVIAGSLGYMIFDIAVLAASFPATGSAVPPLGVLVLAYAVGQLGGLVPLPGGIGATGGGLVGAFVLYGGSIGPVTAAVVVYRVIQVGVPALLGVPAFALLRRHLRGADAPMAICEPLAEDRSAAAAVAV
jgi:uncharacterized membrane protein YbhN (UPF0104 family)